MILKISKRVINLILIMGLFVSITSCTTPIPQPPEPKGAPQGQGMPGLDSHNQSNNPNSSGLFGVDKSNNANTTASDEPTRHKRFNNDDNGQNVYEKASIHSTNPMPNEQQIGLLFPFSKLVSSQVKMSMAEYYDDFESKLLNALQRQGVVVTETQYPSNQQPFTYDEMNAPTFTIDPDDFTSPTQVLKGISSQGFSQMIFGHVEEISGFLYLVARIYSSADNQIGSALTQKINIATLTNSVEIDNHINQLATDIANRVAIGSPFSQSPETGSENGLPGF